jgi:hypothetical protein
MVNQDARLPSQMLFLESSTLTLGCVEAENWRMDFQDTYFYNNHILQPPGKIQRCLNQAFTTPGRGI